MGMDTEEMYRRGVADAAQGEPHPFYYQHYYQYRRGYDRARRSHGLMGGYYDLSRRRKRLIGLALAVLVAAGVVVALRWRARAVATAELPTPLPALAAASTHTPTRTPIFPTPTPQPTPTQVALHVGGMAQVVNLEGAVLRGRKQPSLKAAATASFKQGERLRVLEGPTDADGFTWWKVEGKSGTGWSAQRSPEGVEWLQPLAEQ